MGVRPWAPRGEEPAAKGASGACSRLCSNLRLCSTHSWQRAWGRGKKAAKAACNWQRACKRHLRARTGF